MTLAIRYLAVLVVLAAGDFAWLSWFGPNVFRPMAGSIMLENPRWSAIILFYLLYTVGVVLFPLGLARGLMGAALYGALFGFMAYMTYDATNFATLKAWTAPVALADIAWGSFLTAMAAAAGYATGMARA
jgi:uncharacterized membrane protein